MRVRLVAAGHDAAVDVENRAGDPAGVVGEQIRDGVGRRRRECRLDPVDETARSVSSVASISSFGTHRS